MTKTKDKSCPATSVNNSLKQISENQMVRILPFGKVQKLWAAGWGDAYFLFFLISSADLATL